MARKPKLDTVLAEAVDTARAALAEIADDAEVGEYVGAEVEGERLVTHRFVSYRTGYHGWTWFVTLARVPRAKAKDATVCEVGIIPGDEALLAPAWVPWAERLAQEEIDAAKQTDDQPQDADGAQAAPAQETAASDGPDADQAPERAERDAAADTESDTSDSSDQDDEPARRPVRRRRTAQRTAARRRAAARSRARKSGE